MHNEELDRLGGLHAEGILSEKEFLKMKALLRSEPPSKRTDLSLSNWYAELECIDREWQQKQEKFKRTLRYGNRVLPSRESIAMSVVGLLLLCVFVWFCTTLSDSSGNAAGFAVLITFLWSLCTWEEAARYADYQKAKASYEEQRHDHLQRKP